MEQQVYASLALGLMDAVWSIGVRYTGVLNVLHRYRAARRGAGANPDRDTPADLIAFIGSCGGPDTFAAAVNNRQRTSSRNGILKADAVLRVAQVLVDAEVQTPKDLAAATPGQLAEVRHRWTAITGRAPASRGTTSSCWRAARASRPIEWCGASSPTP